MNITFDIPVFDGCWTDILWDGGAHMRVQRRNGIGTIWVDRAGLCVLAKQLLYFGCNNALSGGCAEFCRGVCGDGFDGVPLYVEFLATESVEGNELYDAPVIHPSVTVMAELPKGPVKCPPECRLDLAAREESVKITGDEKGFLFLARYVTSLAYGGPEQTILRIACANGAVLCLERRDEGTDPGVGTATMAHEV